MTIDEINRMKIQDALRGKGWVPLTELRRLTGYSANASPSLRTAVLALQREGVVVTTREWEAPFSVALNSVQRRKAADPARGRWEHRIVRLVGVIE